MRSNKILLLLGFAIFVFSSVAVGYWFVRLNYPHKSKRTDSRLKSRLRSRSTIPLNNNSIILNRSTMISNKKYFIIPSTGKVGKILQQRGWISTNNAREANFVWVQNKKALKKILPWKSIHQNIIINHLEYERELGHKGRLLHYLTQQFGIGGYKYMQPSWRLWVSRERSAFLHYHEQQQKQQQQQPIPLIIKQAHKDNGNGISILSTPKQIARLLSNVRKKKNIEHAIVQRYVVNPLLTTDQKKFDLRIYFLIASLDPLIVLYHDGYLRVALDVYSPTINKHTKRSHLTNAKVQKSKNMKQYSKNKETTRRPFSAMREILNKKTSLDDIRCNIMRALVDIIKAERIPIQKSHSRCPLCFSLLGADFLLDTDNHVWISEVQSGPGLPTTTNTTKVFFKQLLPSVIDIMEEIDQNRKRMSKTLLPLNKLKNFHVMINEEISKDNPSAWPSMRVCRQKSKSKQEKGHFNF